MEILFSLSFDAAECGLPPVVLARLFGKAGSAFRGLTPTEVRRLESLFDFHCRSPSPLWLPLLRPLLPLLLRLELAGRYLLLLLLPELDLLLFR